MAKARTSTPLDGFADHFIGLVPSSSGQAVGDCPFCGKEDRFYVNMETGAWDCKVCSRSGSFLTFLEEMGKLNSERFRGSPALRLAKDRGLKVATFRAWRVGWDGRQFTVPVDICGKTYDLRRFRLGGKTRATTRGRVSLAGIMDPDSDTVWLLEGEWDGMALWESLERSGASGSVAAVCGGGAFPQHGLSLFEGKNVIVAFDNDSAGQKGAQRVYRMLHGLAKSLAFVHWTEDTPDKFDVRDLYLRSGADTPAILRGLLKDSPPGLPAGSTETAEELTGPGLDSEEVTARFRKWLYLPNTEALTVMFGVLLANRLPGDPVWLYMVAPSGGSKSELLMTLQDAPLVWFLSKLSPKALISGMVNSGQPDPSLLPLLDGKVLVIKDFTVILKMRDQDKDEIYGTLRDAYDGRVDQGWGTGVFRTYQATFGVLSGVTKEIEKERAGSTLGERFLKYYLPMDGLGNLRSHTSLVRKALDNIAEEPEMRLELRQTAREVLNRPVDVSNPPTIPEAIKDKLVMLAQWIAALRGVVVRERFTRDVEYSPTPEVGTRVAKQLAKLGMGIALFRRVEELDESIYQVVVKVARDTVPDRVECIVRHLYMRTKTEWVTAGDLSKWSKFPDGTVRRVLEDLELLNIVVASKTSRFGGGKSYRLSRTMLRLMRPLDLYQREESFLKTRRNITKRPKTGGRHSVS